jgi:hypothetical protein
MLIEMKVYALTVDPFTNAPIVILKDLEEKSALPVWIGSPEASAIASELESVEFSRPMTHDLIKKILTEFGAKVLKIQINDIRESVFYATIHLETPSGPITIDSRPSDAIALALRTEATIYVDTHVLDKSKSIDLRTQEGLKSAETPEELLNMLDDFEPEEFGKYKM